MQSDNVTPFYEAGVLARIQGRHLIDNPFHRQDGEASRSGIAAGRQNTGGYSQSPNGAFCGNSGQAPPRGRFRVVFRGDETAARDRFRRMSERLRQGTVSLHDPLGNRTASDSAPRLRTRW
jgi:hypothetical protein